MKAWPILGIGLMQIFLSLAHWFIFHTLVVFCGNLLRLKLWHSVSRSSCWPSASSPPPCSAITFPTCRSAHLSDRRRLARLPQLLLLCRLPLLAGQPGSACFPRSPRPCRITARSSPASSSRWPFLTGIYGLLNARWVRVRRITIQLPNLPASWRGRTALLLSDLHLGNVNGPASAAAWSPSPPASTRDRLPPRRPLRRRPYRPARLVAPFENSSPPLGIYFSAGNHEEYGGEAHFSQRSLTPASASWPTKRSPSMACKFSASPMPTPTTPSDCAPLSKPCA